MLLPPSPSRPYQRQPCLPEAHKKLIGWSVGLPFEVAGESERAMPFSPPLPLSWARASSSYRSLSLSARQSFLFITAFPRFLARLRDRLTRPRRTTSACAVLVYGAGRAATGETFPREFLLRPTLLTPLPLRKYPLA